MPNVNPNSGGQKNGGQPLAPSDNYGNSDDDEDGQNDDIESPHTEDMQMTSSGVPWLLREPRQFWSPQG